MELTPCTAIPFSSDCSCVECHLVILPVGDTEGYITHLLFFCCLLFFGFCFFFSVASSWAFLMPPSVSVCPSNKWIFSSSIAARLQLTQRESLLVSGRKWNTAHLLQITAAVLSLAIGLSGLEVHVEETSQTFPPQTQLATLCAWQMTYVLNLTRKADINCPVSQIFGLVKCLLSWLHGDTDRQGCLTLPGRLETQGEPRSYHIKHAIHALMAPTCSAPLQPSTSSGGKSCC